MHPHTSHEKPTPDVDVPVRPPQTGVNTASGVRGLGVEFLELGSESPPARVAHAAGDCMPTSLRLAAPRASPGCSLNTRIKSSQQVKIYSPGVHRAMRDRAVLPG